MSATADDPGIRRPRALPPRLLPVPALPAPEDDGRTLPFSVGERYRLYTRLGPGAPPNTFRARDLVHGRVVAVTIVQRDADADPAAEQAFLDRASAIGEVTHPSVLGVLAAGLSQDRLYVVSELPEGDSLRRLLQQRGRLPIYLAVRIAAEIAEALDVLHRQGLVHGDLRPENILVGAAGRVRLAGAVGAFLRDAPGAAGNGPPARSDPYQAPEVLRGAPLEPHADTYGLGALVYEMLLGEAPPGPNLLPATTGVTVVPPPTLRGDRPDICWGLEHVVRQALAPTPGERPASLTRFRQALLSPPSDSEVAAELAGTDQTPRTLQLAGRAWPEPRRRPVESPRHRAARGPWRALALTIPIGSTLVVLFALLSALDLLPNLLLPLQIVRVPELQHHTWAEAEAEARAHGLEVVKARPEPCEDRGRDYVFHQEPPPGALSHRGARVRLVSCSGLRVPNLIGQREEQVRLELARRDWPVADVRLVTRPDVAASIVVAQEPTSDVILQDKQPLVLTIAQPPR